MDDPQEAQFELELAEASDQKVLTLGGWEDLISPSDPEDWRIE